LVEPNNEAQLVEAMQAMLNGKYFNPEELRTYALTHFSYAAVGKQLDELYDRLIK
jgi:glycosyltransferase involved in cell wall biosynthesis